MHNMVKKGIIIDDYSVMEIASDKPAYIDDSYSYFSLLNISGTAKGINITDAKYPLTMSISLLLSLFLLYSNCIIVPSWRLSSSEIVPIQK